jgi:apolipoprotein N-acyltransferase
MNKYSLVGLSVAGGILSGLAWTSWFPGLILLFSFVPFLTIENFIFYHRRNYSENAFFIYILPGFIIFSIISLGWMRVASVTGAICVIMGLSFLMAFTMWLAHIIRLRAGTLPAIISLVVFWLAYEYITLNVSIISPWLNLGNGLSKDIMFIQWYEITGTAGGTLWILLSNILLTMVLENTSLNRRKNRIMTVIWLSVILIPALISVIRFNTLKQNEINSEEVVIVQPNADPYTQKFKVPFDDQLKKVIALASSVSTDKTAWIITPETTIDDPVNLDGTVDDKYIKKFRGLAEKFPEASIVAGMVTFKKYPPSEEPPTNSARKTDDSGSFTDHFNSALMIDTSENTQFYHKSKLVPGIEMQTIGPGRLINRILPYLGGTKWGYGSQKTRTCFTHENSLNKVAPIICYESVFGEYVTGYVKNGAGALFIITNDGWWKGTGGYKQHLNFASLRAIETRRPVARAGNTGVSCFIDIRGRITEKSKWWTQTAMRGKIFPENRITPYVKHGDFLMRISIIMSILLLLYTFIALPFFKKNDAKY